MGARSTSAGRSTSRRSGSGTRRSPAIPAGSRWIPGSKKPLSGLSGSLPTIGSVRILVVDDEPSVRDALDRALRMDGYKVQLAADGQQALDQLAEQALDGNVHYILNPEGDG